MDKNKLISFLFFVLNILVAVFVALEKGFEAGKWEGFIAVVGAGVLGLFCVWYPEEMGGGPGWNFQNSPSWVPTPPFMMSVLGWIFLIIAPVILVLDRVWKN